MVERFAVRRGDVELSCLDTGAGSGDGPAVVLLPGLTGTAEELLPTATALAPDRRAVCVDQRGHGRATRRPDDVSRTAFVADTLAVVRAVTGRSGPAVDLVGRSTGGHTALLVAAARPDRVRRLVLAEAGVGGEGTAKADALGRSLASWPVPFADRAAAAAYLGDSAIARARVAALEPVDGGGLAPPFDADVMTAIARGVLARARWDAWDRVTAPTLLVVGEHGDLDPAEVDAMQASRPAVRRHVLAGAGHDLHLERPAEWHAVVRAFLLG